MDNDKPALMFCPMYYIFWLARWTWAFLALGDPWRVELLERLEAIYFVPMSDYLSLYFLPFPSTWQIAAFLSV